MKKNVKITSLISRLAAAEEAFLRTRFLAPVTGCGSVQVRIGGAVCRMRVRPYDFAGWGVFQPTSYTFAKLAREATLTERRKYLDLFPVVRLILTERFDGSWLAVPAQLNDTRFGIEEAAVVHGVEDAELFDAVIARCDGTRFWFDEIDPSADPMIAAQLRESIIRMRDPKLIDCVGMSREMRAAYASLHARRIAAQLESNRATGEYRIRTALEHAGATMTGFSEIDNSYRVSYSVGSHRHVSLVGKKDLAVQSAGICLDGQDAMFDLASLVGVMREGHENGEIYEGH